MTLVRALCPPGTGSRGPSSQIEPSSEAKKTCVVILRCTETFWSPCTSTQTKFKFSFRQLYIADLRLCIEIKISGLSLLSFRPKLHLPLFHSSSLAIYFVFRPMFSDLRHIKILPLLRFPQRSAFTQIHLIPSLMSYIFTIILVRFIFLPLPFPAISLKDLTKIPIMFRQSSYSESIVCLHSLLARGTDKITEV
jgi:hypothetical protein